MNDTTLNPTFIKSRNLNTLWFDCLQALLSNPDRCRIWTVEGKQGDADKGDLHDRSYIGSGSFVGQRRWEFEMAFLHVTHPGDRPLVPDVPDGIPAPTDMEYVEDYYTRYLVGTERAEGETYTYGERVQPQIEPIIEKFTQGGWGSNQCTISVAKPEDIFLPDPPCLRSIDFRVYPEEALRPGEVQALHMKLDWRSWDLWAGLPSNLAALRLLQEDMAAAMGIEAGELFAVCKGLHAYEDAWTSALRRIGEQPMTPEQLLAHLRG
jgi:thymidylate synthase